MARSITASIRKSSFILSAGSESDNYSSLDLQNRTTSGYGVDWAPTERTLLSIKKDQRGFGAGHSIDFSHRTALTAWKFIDSRSVMLPAQQLTVAQVSTAYDLLFLLLASDPLYSDPVARAQAVASLLQLRRAFRRTVRSLATFMSSQPFIQRQQLASVALMGVNNTVTLAAQRSSNERIGTGVSTLDDFALSTEHPAIRTERQLGAQTLASQHVDPECADLA